MVRTGNEIARQVRWEMLGVERAVAAAREAVEEAEREGRGHEMPAGRKILKEVVRPLTAALEAAQAEAVEALGRASGGRPPGWMWPIGLVQADRLAVITLARTLGNPIQGSQTPFTTAVTPLSLVLADSVRDQVEYESWMDAEDERNRRAAAEAKQSGKERGERVRGLWGSNEADVAREADTGRKEALRAHKNLVKAFEEKYPDANRRTWGKWRAKIKAARVEAWPKEEVKIPLGMKLIHTLVETAPDRFQLDNEILKGGMTQRIIRLTDQAREEMRDINARMEVARPRLMPMVIKPNPWRYEQ